MAGSCAYCGTPLDQNGLCPNCGNENETTGLLTPEETPAFYTQAQGQSPAPGGHAPAYPAPGPAAPAYPQAAPGPVAPAYPQAAPDPVAPAYHKAAPGPAAPPKPKKNGGGKKIALAVGVAVLAVGLLVGLLFVLGVIRLPEKGDPLADEIFFLVTPAEHIRQDEKNGTFYADNELLVVARPGVKKREMETVAARHNATVVGCIEMTGDYQLQLETQMSPEELDRRALAIASEPEIESAARNTVIPLRKTASAPEGAWTAEASPASGGDAYWNLRLIRATDSRRGRHDRGRRARRPSGYPADPTLLYGERKCRPRAGCRRDHGGRRHERRRLLGRVPFRERPVLRRLRRRDGG